MSASPTPLRLVVLPGLLLASVVVAEPLPAVAPQAQVPATGRPFDGQFRPAKDLPGVEEAYLPPLFPSSHAANLLQLSSGDLMCVWFTGSKEGASDVAIATARLARGSSRWSTPRVVDHRPGESFQNPVLFQAPDGALWLFHTTQRAGMGQSKSAVLVTKSRDDGVTWTAPQVLFGASGAFTRQRLLILPGGRWLLPMYFTPGPAMTHYSVVKVSDDGGAGWKEYRIPQSFGCVQPCVLRQKNGRYVAFFRSRKHDFIYTSISGDGYTWTAPHETGLPNNNSSIQVAALEDGNYAIAFNNVGSVPGKEGPQAGPRKPLTVALSIDEGASWGWARDLETGRDTPPGASDAARKEASSASEEYSYPSILGRANGEIDVAYTYNRETIKVVRFSENWVKAGMTSGTFKPDAR